MKDQTLSLPAVIFVTLLAVLLPSFSTTAQTNNVQPRLEQAAALIRDNKIPEAEQQLISILKTAPDDAAALNMMGTIRAQQGRLNEAENLFTRAAKIAPSFVAVHMNLAFLYLLRNIPEKTISELKEVVRLEPDNVEANYKLARLLLSRGQIDDSIAVVEKVKSTSAAAPAFVTLLGDAYLKKGDPTKAEEYYRQALAAQPENAEAVLGLARIAGTREDAKNTLAYLSRARELAINSPELLYKIGVTALELKAFDEAQAALEQAVKLRPRDASYLTALGATWLKKSDLFTSEQMFRRAIEVQPDNPQTQLYLGYVLYKQKKFSEARVYLEKSVKTETSIPEPFYYLGLIAQEENEDERAVALLEKAVLAAPSFANAHVALGASYLKLKDYPRAQQELELGTRLNPDDSRAHYQLAVLYARLKDPKRAQAEMQIVEKLKATESGKKEGDTFVISPSPNPQ